MLIPMPENRDNRDHSRIRPEALPDCDVATDNAREIADEAAWQAVLARDRAFDGQFVTGVVSTGIYCRPSCAARHPARANVRFFADGPAARAAGLRACRRCLPDDIARDERAVADAAGRIRARIEAGEGAPSLGELAAGAGYSAAHFQRVFARLAGLSPAAYGRALRAGRAADALRGGGRVVDAIYDAGYSAPSRFYDAGARGTGMAPSVRAKGGAGMTIRWAVADTTLGPLLVAATDKGVCRVAFGENGTDLAARFPRAEVVAGGAGLETLLARVVSAIEAPGTAANIPLDLRGTAFQERVWEALRAIPPGETRSYAQIAAAAGNPGAVRAAGTANGANPVAVLVPCHRVIRADGQLGGYAWGLDIKRALLDRERGGG